jgi:uncharacterized cupin superfamily protein
VELEVGDEFISRSGEVTVKILHITDKEAIVTINYSAHQHLIRKNFSKEDLVYYLKSGYRTTPLDQILMGG